ncbi:MAG: hypothetical protein AB7P03_27520 [Kofleriaceae bacterium]
MLLFAACAANNTSNDQQADRGPLGKADAAGSCANSDCSGQAPGGNCYCDTECVAYGDCCADQLLACEPAAADELATMNASELDALFSRGALPEIAALAGELSGRSLANAVIPLPGPIQDAINLVANKTWLGKTLSPVSATTATGFNRVKIGTELQVAHFTAALGTGRDRNGSLHLNYDVDQNPIGVKAIRDELRQVGDGVYLGKAFLHTAVGEPALFFFSLAPTSAPSPQ